MQGLRADKWSYLPLLLALPVIALVLIVASRGPWTAEGKSVSTAEASAIRRTKTLLGGIPQRGAALGDPEAPVTLQFFGDLQCSESRQMMLGALPFLIRHWVRDGKLRIVYRSTKADTPDPAEFRGQQIAAMAAGQQQKMWTFIDLFYREQQHEFTHYADDAFLEGIAEQTGVNLWRWAGDRQSDKWAGKIESDEMLAERKVMESTPSFLIGPSGGPARRLRHFSLEEPGVFDKAIRWLL
jgi:protein-disulfide isomerase